MIWPQCQSLLRQSFKMLCRVLCSKLKPKLCSTGHPKIVESVHLFTPGHPVSKQSSFGGSTVAILGVPLLPMATIEHLLCIHGKANHSCTICYGVAVLYDTTSSKPLSVHLLYTDVYKFLAPNSILPTLTVVLPASIACSKSDDMPMLSSTLSTSRPNSSHSLLLLSTRHSKSGLGPVE